MLSTPVAAMAIAMFRLTVAVPVQLPAAPTTQNDIISLENQIVILTNDVVQTNKNGAQTHYDTADNQFKTIASIVKTPSDFTCPEETAQGQPNTAQAVIDALTKTQDDLAKLSLDLQNSASSAETINTDFCNAYTIFQSTEYYFKHILGTSANGDAKSPVAAVSDVQGYNSNKLDEAYKACLVATRALISALNIIPAGTSSSKKAKDAYKTVQDTIKTYRKVANPTTTKTGSCPPIQHEAAKDPKSAIDKIKEAAYAIQHAYTDTRANNGKAYGDFCRIQGWLTAANSYI